MNPSKNIWSLEEANAFLPRLSALIEEQWRRAAEIQRTVSTLGINVQGDIEGTELTLETALSVADRVEASQDEECALIELAVDRSSRKVTVVRAETMGKQINLPDSVARELHDKALAYEEGWRGVEALGVFVKDAEIGLCDFYGYINSSLVFLCWKYGEPRVSHYHSLDGGYAARKSISDSVKRLVLN